MTGKPKRPRDPNQLAKHIVDVATGTISEIVPEKNRSAVDLGSRGGKRRSELLSAEERSRQARRAAEARWAGAALPSEEENS